MASARPVLLGQQLAAQNIGPSLRASQSVVQIYGANTSVGKTIISTHIIRATARTNQHTLYLKPISTGPQDGSDALHVKRYTFPSQRTIKTLFSYDSPISPHLAATAKKNEEPPSDNSVLLQVQKELHFNALQHARDGSLVLMETAGGPLSPTLTGSLQANLYRPLRLPVVLVADPRLGGISATIAAYEALIVRGYDIVAVATLEDEADNFGNAQYLGHHFSGLDGNANASTKAVKFPRPPPKAATTEEDQLAMDNYYNALASRHAAEDLVEAIRARHALRISQLRGLPESAQRHIWFPFTQHKRFKDGKNKAGVVAIDSAYGDAFQVLDPNQERWLDADRVLNPAFDGSASWWTQGLGHGNPTLALTAGYAAGRYGHVMFAGAVHEPAVRLATTLLRVLNQPRLKKVFYTDNGSTGVEVGLKMALRASAKRYGWTKDDSVKVLALEGCYHGDTIGAMDCAEGSAYNESTLWHKGRAVWLPKPEAFMQGGKWVVRGEGYNETRSWHFENIGELFHFQNRREHADVYTTAIKKRLNALVEEKVKLGALLIEPVIQGADGMTFVDPLFQHVLVNTVRGMGDIYPVISQSESEKHCWTGMPVMADEVFTGLNRLGYMSSSSMIKVEPDISVHAKLLTGGVVPLAATLASESIFEAFLGDEKSQALLHGHSYTAHPVGCSVAGKAIAMMEEQAHTSTSWKVYKSNWDEHKTGIWCMWSPNFVAQLSQCTDVEHVVALGTVLAIKVRGTDSEAGYASNAADDLQKRLMMTPPGEDDDKAEIISDNIRMHTRVLGPIIYFMLSLCTLPADINKLEARLLREFGFNLC